ncbi:metallophosphoesterase [Bdellovibrio bacteriovorus]|uniref:metallophosphoesterase n=1 Tax=Bdellovibrio bacteriovorus TaxID=959 RepID=UPI0035A5C1DC
MKILWKSLFFLTIFISGFLSAWAFWLEPRSLHTQNYSLTINHKKNLPLLRIGIVSDIHIGRYFGDEKRLERIVKALEKEQPDIIVILGDYVAQRDATAFVKAAHQLSKLKAPLGVFSVLGNHDWWSGRTEVVKSLKENGVKLIDNEILELSWGRSKFRLIGLGDFWEDNALWDFLSTIKESPLPSIALTHNPDVFPETPQHISLVLAGHTHGGQVRFPIIGAPIVPSKYGDRYRYGLISEKNHHLLVTSGTGNSILPVRFRVPPEIAVLELSFTQ